MTALDIDSASANQFASTLAHRVSLRARGADDGAARLYRRRPSEHILAGFLTPLRDQQALDWTASQDSNGPSPEVPSDEPHEVTNVGFEWIVPKEAWGGTATIDIEASFRVYVRVLPTYEEARKGVQYQSDWHQRRAKETATRVPTAPRTRIGLLPEAWLRVDLPAFSCSIRLAELAAAERIERSQEAALRGIWPSILATIPDIYPSRTALRITEADLLDEVAYSNWKLLQRHSHSASTCDWSPRVDARVLRMPSDPTALRVALRLVNATPAIAAQQQSFSDPHLYDASIAAHFPKEAHRPGTFRELEQSYRYDRSLAAVGYNAEAELVDNGVMLDLVSHTVPISELKRLDPRSIPGCSLGFDTLASDPLPLLARVATAMRRYDATEWMAKLVSMDSRLRASEGVEVDRLRAEIGEAAADRDSFREREIVAFENGLALLKDSRFANALSAFKMMNEAMGAVATLKGYSEWRLFQIVFIVKSLPELTTRFLPDAADFQPAGDRGKEWVDILWFAAGGGKTEAFFGLLLWQIFLDRLSGKSFGVTALLRFPLRLLTFQQLQRLAQTLAQADLVRRAHHVPGDPFSLGYYVGSNTTPNEISKDRHERYCKDGPPKSYRLLARCPYCRSKDLTLVYEESVRLVLHKCLSETCTNPNAKRLIPLLIVDDDIYRYLPTVIVSTVDKLANVGQQRRFSNLLGRIDRRCSKHGAAFHTSNWLCDASKRAARGERPALCEDQYAVSYGPFEHLSPALQIADELHLLRQELGAFDGHYETTLVDIQRSFGAKPWKIIAATATIEKYEHHAWALYALPSRRFPGPGPTAWESFYYSPSTDRKGRLFMGLLGVGRAHTPAVAKAKSLFLQELEEARQLLAVDPTALGTRFGLPAHSAEDLGALLFLYEIVLTYVLTLKGGDQVAEAVDNRVRYDLADVAGAGHELILRTLNSGVAMTDMIDTMDLIANADAKGDPYQRIRAIITTNIVSHGVDVDRFGIIIFAGFPRQVAEYIQASARVGRTWPGISIFVPTPQAERDRSVFDRFGKFHEYVDRLVEPSAINRWPQPILRRTVPGILSAYLMSVAAQRIGRELSTVQEVQQLIGLQGADCLNADSVVSWVLNALRVSRSPSPRYAEYAETVVRGLYERVLRRPIANDPTQRTRLSEELNAMTSLRDVDEPAQVAIEAREEESIFRAFS